MAFAISCTMKAYEVRGVSSGTSKKGNQYYSIRVESTDGRTAEISCTDEQLFPAVQDLRKTAIYNFDVRAISSKDYSYLTLVAAPVLVEEAYR